MYTLFLITFAPIANWEPQSVHQSLDDCTAALVQMVIEEGQALVCKPNEVFITFAIGGSDE